jgi:hypothetical protein
MFSTTIFTNLDESRTECEISDDSSVVAVVYEGHDGWHVNSLRTLSADEREAFDASMAEAKERLSHYVNRFGEDVPEGLTLGGLSLWLMQKDDGTAMGFRLEKSEGPNEPATQVPADIRGRVRSLAQEGRQIEAIREIRMATNCSLEQAKAWLKDNC